MSLSAAKSLTASGVGMGSWGSLGCRMVAAGRDVMASRKARTSSSLTACAGARLADGEVYPPALMAPEGLRLERVDERVGELWEDTAGRDHPAYCSHGADLHLMWAARESPPHLRLHWVDGNGQRGVAEHRPQPSAYLAARTPGGAAMTNSAPGDTDHTLGAAASSGAARPAIMWTRRTPVASA